MDSTRLTSRKFILAMATLILASILVYQAKISDGVYSTIIVATVGVYLASNVYQKRIQGEEK